MDGENILSELSDSDKRHIWLRAFYGFDPEGSGYIGFTKPADQTEMLSKMRAGDLVLIYGAVESLTQKDLRAQALGFLRVTEEPCDDRSRMSDAAYKWKVDRGFQERWMHGIKIDRAWRIRNRVPIKTIAPNALANEYRFERTTRAMQLEPEEVKRALSHYVSEVPVFGEPFLGKEPSNIPMATIWPPSRGPRPSFGERNSSYADGETFVYLMELEGLTDRLINGNSTHSIFKAGRSNAPKRREGELNEGFPPSSSKRWKLIRSERFSDADTAHDIEDELKSQLHSTFGSQGGEFFAGPKKDVEALFGRVCFDAMHKVLGAKGRASGVR